MSEKFDFQKLKEQAKSIDEGIEGIRNKIINCDIGNGDATDALSSLDSDLSEIEGRLDFLVEDMREDIADVVETNIEIRKFIDDLDSKIGKLEAYAREHKSPLEYSDTPVSGRSIHPRYLK